MRLPVSRKLYRRDVSGWRGLGFSGAVLTARLARFGSPIPWAATVVFVALMVFWSVLTPWFRNPDEPQHVNSVVRLMQGGGWPAPAEAVMTAEVLRAKTLSGFSAVDGQQGNWAGGTLLPGVRPDIAEEDLVYFALYSAQAPTPPAERPSFADMALTRQVDLSEYPDQMTQHPPLYYALTAGVLEVAGADDWRFDRAMALMRLVGVVLVAPLPLIASSVTVRLTGRRRMGDVAAFLPLGIPQLAALGGSVTNDAMVISLGAVLVLLLTRVLTGDRSWRTTAGIGLTLGLALLVKGTLLVAIPVVGLALVVAGRRSRMQSWREVAGRLSVAWGVAFVVGGWWWALNLLRYGTVQPAGWSEQVQAALVIEGPRDSVVGFAVPFADKLATTFWGRFGQLELALSGWLVAVLTIALIACLLLAFRSAVPRPVVAVLLALAVLMLLLLYPQTYAAHAYNGQYAGIQGRYLYGGIVALLAVASVGIGTLVRPGGRTERWLPVGTLAAVLAVAGYAMWFAFHGYYVDIGWSVADGWQRMTDWAAFPAWCVTAMFAGVVLAALGSVAVAVVQALRPAAGDGCEHGGSPGWPPSVGTAAS
ncbi:UNVERIFIED_ORG: hypothetical protein E4P37_16135 [Bacillus sp. AZ43]